MKQFLLSLFGIYLTLGINHDIEFKSTEEKADIHTDKCFNVPDLYCGFEYKFIQDGYNVDEYKTRTLYIEKTFTISE